MSSGRVVVRVEGGFDAALAHVIWAAYVPGVTGFTLDLTRARQIQDSGIAVLAGRPELAIGSVNVTGLARHHERLLRYLGAPVQDGPRTPPDGPEAARHA